MKITTLSDVLRCCEGRSGERIVVEESTRSKARRCIDRMIEYGG